MASETAIPYNFIMTILSNSNNNSYHSSGIVSETSASDIAIGILGLGSIGCLIASQLPSSIHCYALLQNSADVINFSIEDETARSDYQLRTWQQETLDLLIICCKASQTLGALTQWQSAIGQNTQIVLLQNGFGQHDQVHHLFPNHTLYAASTTEGANRQSRYQIKHAGKGVTQWGYYAGPNTPLKLNLPELKGEHHYHNDIKQVLRDKLAINAVINPLTVKYNCANGNLLTDKNAFSEFKKLCVETESFFTTLNWPLSFDLYHRAQQVAQQTANNISSMLQDFRNQQETEIDYINNYLIIKAKEKNLKLPLNQALVNYIKKV